MSMTIEKSLHDFGSQGNRDPHVPNWEAVEIPDAWPDLLELKSPGAIWSFLKLVAAKKRPTVELPEDMPGRDMIPKYILREFHNFPNGNYSKVMTQRYINNFDRFMLGEIKKLRKRLASEFEGVGRVLDVGCSGGGVAAELVAVGVDDVWGIDPSPYLLKSGAEEYPNIKFIQGIAEDTGFPDRRFDGATACFLFHEMPIKYVEQSLKELNRILEPGSLLTIGEPSPTQAYSGYWEMTRRYGLKGLYFSWFAKTIHEPFLDTWHNCDLESLFGKHGFDLVKDEVGMPIRYIVARKREQTTESPAE
ncbi:MAG: methyltransferase domain-containing protein [Candidatus Thiodiazotropha sp. DIVDIV]